MKKLKIFIPYLVLVLCFVSGLMLYAQSTSKPATAPSSAPGPTAPAPPLALTPTKLQDADLHVAQLQLAIASNNVQAALQEFNRVCGSIIVENKWPDGTRCDPQTRNIVPPPPVANVPPAPQPTPAAKK